MIKETLKFTLDEAKQIFTEAGLTVERRLIPHCFQPVHRPEYWEDIPTWIVINPHTGAAEPLVKLFSQYIENKKSQLFLTAEKLEIYSLFNK